MAEELREITDESMLEVRGAAPSQEGAKKRRAPRRFKLNARQESDNVRDIIKYLEGIGCKPIKNHGTIYGQRGRPDIEVDVMFGMLPFAVPFYIEVKIDRETDPRPQQKYRIEQKLAEGAVAFVAADPETVREAIEMTRQTIMAWFLGEPNEEERREQ